MGVHGSRGEGGSCHSSSNPLDAKEDQEVQSPLKAPQEAPERVQNTERGRAGRKLDMDGADNARIPDRKWKSKRSGPELQTPDLNVPVGSNDIVPIGLVNSRVFQLDSGAESTGGSLEETLKKQRRGSLTNNARSVVAAIDSPRWAK